MIQVKKPFDTSICGSLDYLVQYFKKDSTYESESADYNIGIFLTDRAFKEPSYKGGSKEAYWNGLAKKLEQSLRELINMRSERLRGQLRYAEDRVRELRLHEEHSPVHNLGSVIYGILHNQSVTSENFDEDGKEVIRRIGNASLELCLDASNHKRGDSLLQYR
ncbi:hypothetical protein HYX18_00910, partial [Candidatus Woesearchaeota archaeon]|nr:hypothetical protein [Candidatus Woesearchaeota archaeon]